MKKAEWFIDREIRAETDSIFMGNKTLEKETQKAERIWCKLIHVNVKVANLEGKSSASHQEKTPSDP